MLPNRNVQLITKMSSESVGVLSLTKTRRATGSATAMITAAQRSGFSCGCMEYIVQLNHRC